MSDLGSTYSNPMMPTNSSGGLMSGFRNNRVVSGSTEFLYSNSLVAKVAFLILIIILFIFFLRLGTQLLNWLLGPSTSPILLDGMKDGKKAIIIEQDPKINGAIPIMRSDNERYGTEFTYSVWIFIDDINYKTGQYKHIFNKGSEDMNKSKYNENSTIGMAFPNNGPGLYLTDDKNEPNKLVIVMNTFDQVIEEVEVPNIPLNKWINVVLRVKNKIMDVYINGNIAVRHKFEAVPRQNYGKLFINMNGGFSGEISTLRYYNRALSGVEIANNNNSGPNMKTDKSMNIFPPYFSLKWFFHN
jgi:hypothetical protein|uniref:LamG-like jellyroll fold domain-containing protein n=1 Tax=viral metagenome TaxID=1070528 RepID=A0A6C0C1S0_9ZZZZ